MHAAGLIAAALTFSSRSEAQSTGSFRFAWARDEGAERCPDGPTIAVEVTRRLGRDPFVTTRAPSIEASVRRVGARWLARLVVRDAADAPLGAREFTSESDDCAAIASAVTLGVMLSIDPEAALRPPPPPPPPPPLPPPPPPTAPAQHWSAGASLALRFVTGLRVLPNESVSFGASVATELPLRDRWRLLAGATDLPSVRADRGPSLAYGLTEFWAGAGFDFYRNTFLAIGAQAAVHVGAVQAFVLEGEPSSPGDHPWLAASFGARVRVRLVGPLRLEVTGEGIVPITPYRFFAEGRREPLAEQFPVAGAFSAGLGVQFR